MRILGLHLWKEWREQRVAVLALLGLLPVLVLGLAHAVGARTAGSSVFVSCMGLLGLVVALIAIGGELLGGERRSGGQWLERLPGGLKAAFGAKLTVAVVVSVIALGYGLALGVLAALLRGKSPDSLLDGELLEFSLTGRFALDALVVALWVFAASAWSARGMLALLGGALLAVALSLPGWIWPHVNYRPERWEVHAAQALVVGAALASAWWGFVRSDRGSGPWGSAARGIGVGVLGVLPLWGWAGFQCHERDRIDPTSPDVVLEGAWVFDDGQHALVQARPVLARWPYPPLHTFLVDLDAGTRRELDGLDLELIALWNEDAPSSGDPDGVVLERDDETGDRIELDARSGEPLQASSEPGDPVLFDGEAGQGWCSTKFDGRRVFHDPLRGVSFPAREVHEDLIQVSIGPEGWLAWTFDGWFTFDPATGVATPAEWMEAVDSPGPRLADGRMLARTDDDEWVLVDPVEKRLIALDDSSVDSSWSSWPEPARGGDAYRPGEPVLVDIGSDRYLLDEERLELRPADASYDGRLLRWFPDGTLFFLTDAGIERRDPDGTRQVAFALIDAQVD